MKIFLNRFMKVNRHLELHTENQLTDLFRNTIEAAYKMNGVRVFKLERGILASLFDCTMVGLAKRLEKGPIKDFSKAKDMYTNLVSDPEFYDLLIRSTADEKNFFNRMTRMTKAFADVP